MNFPLSRAATLVCFFLSSLASASPQVVVLSGAQPAQEVRIPARSNVVQFESLQAGGTDATAVIVDPLQALNDRQLWVWGGAYDQGATLSGTIGACTPSNPGAGITGPSYCPFNRTTHLFVDGNRYLDALKVAASNEAFVIIRRGTNSVWTWGSNEYDQLGNMLYGYSPGQPHPNLSSCPQQVRTGIGSNDFLARIIDIDAASHSVIALKQVDGESVASQRNLVFSWGSNANRQLGRFLPSPNPYPNPNLGAGQSDTVPRPVDFGNFITFLDFPGQIEEIIKLSHSSGSTYGAITSAGRLLVWGNNSKGQYGDGSTTTQVTPTSSGNPWLAFGERPIEVCYTRLAGIVLTSPSGMVGPGTRVWGTGQMAESGIGGGPGPCSINFYNRDYLPLNFDVVFVSGEYVVQIAANNQSGFALTNYGRVMKWGRSPAGKSPPTCDCTSATTGIQAIVFKDEFGNVEYPLIERIWASGDMSWFMAGTPDSPIFYFIYDSGFDSSASATYANAHPKVDCATGQTSPPLYGCETQKLTPQTVPMGHQPFRF